MGKSVNDYMKIIYADNENLSEEDKAQYEKDEEFLTKYLKVFEERCAIYERSKEAFSEETFYKTVLKMTKEDYDPETRIVNCVKGLIEVWETNNILTERTDLVRSLIDFGNRKSEEYKHVILDNTPITIGRVYELTEEFLGQIDEEGKLIEEFKRLKDNEGIEFIPPYEERNSFYSSEEGKIYYKFDGTVNTADTLVHEFMHHLCEKDGQTSVKSYNFTLFREFLSIYYENAFIQYMNEKGVLPNGPAPLLAKRLKSQNEKDPDNCLAIYMELVSKYNRNDKKMDKKTILSIASNYFPDIKNEEILWDSISGVLVNFLERYPITYEPGIGLTTYKFSTALSHATSLKSENIRKMFRMAQYIKSDKNDIEIFNYYIDQIGKTEQEFMAELVDDSNAVAAEPTGFQISTGEIGKRTVKPGQTKDKERITNIFKSLGLDFSRKRGDMNDRQ